VNPARAWPVLAVALLAIASAAQIHARFTDKAEEVRTTDNGVAHKGLAFGHGTTVDGRAGERARNSLRPALETATGDS
jgi:hypothetical protein